jgi:HSP20 family protein
MEALGKKKRICSVNASWFLPTMNTFFDDFLSKDLMENDCPNFATLGTNLPSVNLKETEKIEIELAAPGLKKKILKLN